MKVLLLHLSDLHLNSERDSIFAKNESIAGAIQNLASDCDHIFTIVSGDIANTGRYEEYIAALDFLERLKIHIKSRTHKDVIYIIIPGNHDCNFEIKNKSIRDRLIASIKQNPTEIDSELVKQCCEVQNEYFDFACSYQTEKQVSYSSSLCNVFRYKVSDVTIQFYCYNTAWMSELHEQPSKLYFPLMQISQDLKRVDPATVNISILHHPFNWYSVTNSKEFSEFVEANSQLILTGHNHITGKSLKDDMTGNLTEYIEGSRLQNLDDPQDSGFNAIKLNLDTKTQRIIQYSWQDNLYIANHDTQEIEYKTSISVNAIGYRTIKNEFQNYLSDVGSQLRHPNKPDISLNDIFVFPYLKDLRAEKKKDASLIQNLVRSNELLNFSIPRSNCLIMGAENSGKTTLCKILFNGFHKNGFTPILLNGDEIKSTRIDDFISLVERNFCEQYAVNSSEQFTQEDNIKKVIIIDDYHKFRKNYKAKGILLGKINNHYPNIILTANDMFQVEDLISEDQKTNPARGYRHFLIMQFGNSLRTELIEKWNSLGLEETLEDIQLFHRNDETRRLVETIIGKNFVPSFPVFILMILQGMEMGYPHDLQESSYGFYYQMIIGASIKRVVHTVDKIDAYNNFLKDLAFYLFSNKTQEISLQVLTAFHMDYCSIYRIGDVFIEMKNLPTLISNLTQTGMLRELSGRFRFKYKYVYYFFLAKFLADSIDIQETKSVIAEMAKRLYVEDFANTIMFLTYHSKNPFILDVILENSRTVFSECVPVKFEKDVSLLNNLLKEIPKRVIEVPDVNEHRKKIDEYKDQLEVEENDEEDDISQSNMDFNQEITNLDLVGKLNLTFKTLEILGQILKNYHSSLKGDRRYSIAEEAYNLGLRSLEPFFDALQNHSDHIVEGIKDVIEKKKLTDPSRIEDLARRVLFNICIFVSTGFVAKIADCVGSEFLSETYKEVAEKNTSNSVKLIDICIKLVYFGNFPMDELKTLAKEFDSNYFAGSILEELVVGYLYMYPTTYKQKQTICSILNIPMKEQRLIDLTSKEKKR